jgi:anaphase-promoting complex subunit 5
LNEEVLFAQFVQNATSIASQKRLRASDQYKPAPVVLGSRAVRVDHIHNADQIEMTRYLTPAKIGLLALIELYTESSIPTASMLSVLSFIISHILPTSLPEPQNAPSHGAVPSRSPPGSLAIQDFQKLLSAQPSASGLPGRTVWDHFLKKLWDIDSLDALHAFFDGRSNLLVRTREELKQDEEMGIAPPGEDVILLSRTSPFGAFVRRSQLEFARLKFHDAMGLWKQFIRYRQPTLGAWSKRNPVIAKARWAGFDLPFGDVDEDWGGEELARIAYGGLIDGEAEFEAAVSTDDVEKLLEFQVEQMQSKSCRDFQTRNHIN